MWDSWVVIGLLWLAGAGLRLTVLAVPPVILLIAADLNLSGTEIGVLSGLPVILFGVAALPGSLLIARFGALRTLVAGLLIAGAASGLRGVMPNVLVLYAATIVMSAGIAIMQPALPPLVQEWMPKRVTFGTAVCTNGLLVGETLPVMLTVPLVLPLADGSWRGGLAIWGVPLVLTAMLVAVLAPAPKPMESASAAAKARSWWPDWRNKLNWQLGILFGSVNSSYFGVNAFLPGHLTGAGRPDLIAAALTALNFGQVPASFLLLAAGGRLELRAWPLITCGALMLLCLAGIAITGDIWTVVFAGLLGFLGAFVLTLGFALPALLTEPSDVARMSAAMFTISYSEGLFVAVLSGAAWDLTGSPRFAFLPMAIALSALLVVPLFIRFRRAAAKP
jgi:CP family cyanate transporter-like MFS transporter